MRACCDPVAALLPHEPPMILLDEVLRCDETSLVAAATITRASLFLEPEGVPAYVGIEYMAQACGAYAGAIARAEGEPVRIGFLLGTRRYETAAPWFRVGDRLTVSVSVIYRDSEMGAFDCRIERGGELLAAAQLNLYQPKDAHHVLAGETRHD